MVSLAQQQATAQQSRRVVRARYDAAADTDDSRRHWANADNLSAATANSPEVRSKLRRRARYEIANNSYARGITLTLANDLIGTGPRLQISGAGNQQVAKDFANWAFEVRLADKLHTMRLSKCGDGEAFAIFTTDLTLKSPAKLNFELVEADRVTTPYPTEQTEVDGIRLKNGKPHTYFVLNYHPGDGGFHGGAADYREYAAEHVIHWFRRDRPGQYRGIPEIMPALPLFANLRRYTLAVIAAAETAADFAGVLYTDTPANGESADAEPFETIELEKRMLVTVPGGWKMGQIKAEQPTTTYGDFKKEILNEIARCLGVPYHIAAGNSSGYNYSSGRLDHQTYYRTLRVEHSDVELTVLDRIFSAWLFESIASGNYPADLINVEYVWFWDGFEHVDPQKEATAQATRLLSFTTTLAAEYAAQGKDWEVEIQQIARERELLKELGLTPQPTTETATDDDQEPDESDDVDGSGGKPNAADSASK